MCCGKDNHIELVFEGEKYIMTSHAPADALPAFNEIVKQALLGRTPGKNVKTMVRERARCALRRPALPLPRARIDHAHGGGRSTTP
jgi:hypothetical protein